MSEFYDARLTITAYSGANEINKCREFWLVNQNHPNVDLDFFETVVRNRPEVENPVAFVVSYDGAVRGIAAARIERVPFKISLGYLVLAKQSLRRLTFIHDGLVGSWDRGSLHLLVGYVKNFIKEHGIHFVLFSVLDTAGEFYRQVRHDTPLLQRSHFTQCNPHWSMDLPSRYEDFLAKTKSKHRTYLRGCEKKLEKVSGPVAAKVFTTGTAAFCDAAEQIASKTYQRKIGAGFVDTKELRERLALEEKRQGFRGYFLYAGAAPCAFWLGTLYRSTFYLDYTGYDPRFTDYAPGQILFMKMIEDLCALGRVTTIDFGQGDAAYKQRFGDRNYSESDVFIFNGTIKMIALNFIQTLIGGARAAFERIFDKGEIIAKIKKIWRNKMQRGLAPQPGETPHE